MVVNSHGIQRSADQEHSYFRCLTSIIIWSEPQRLHRDVPSTPYPFPQVGISTGCEGDLFLHLEIFVDQARLWQPPECTTYSPKYSKRSTFEIARDVRMLKDLQEIGPT